jgi:hypothetical protein
VLLLFCASNTTIQRVDKVVACVSSAKPAFEWQATVNIVKIVSIIIQFKHSLLLPPDVSYIKELGWRKQNKKEQVTQQKKKSSELASPSERNGWVMSRVASRHSRRLMKWRALAGISLT